LVSEAVGSQSKLCLIAISFRRFSFFSSEGVWTDNSSINCHCNWRGA